MELKDLHRRTYAIDEGIEMENSGAERINTMIRDAIGRKASDIHLEPYGKEMIVKFRCDGLLDEAGIVPEQLCNPVINRIKVMAEMNSLEKRLPQDGHMAVSLQGRIYDIRVSSLPLFQGEKMVLRIMGTENRMPDLEDLGFSPENLLRMQYLLSMPGGLILICGPTGSGKTTTLYSMLQKLRKTGKNIITLEDPVEYEMAGVNQVQINDRTGLTFAKGLRSILRQDPDIIMVGEIRDGESAEIALRLAYTGHLVLASLHTGDALGAVNRLVEMGIAPYMLASCLNGVIAQRLVRKTVNDCYLGRIAIQEILLCDEALQRDIADYVHFREKKKSIEAGYATLWQDGLMKVKAGLTDLHALQDVLGPIMHEGVKI